MRKSFSMLLLLAVLLATSGKEPMPAVQSASSSNRRPAVHAPAPENSSETDDVANLLSQVTQDNWFGWIRKLSGAEPVTVGGKTVTILTRYSTYLFDGRSPAYDYVRQQIEAWYPAGQTEGQIEEDSYQTNYDMTRKWKNLILTIPGTEHPEQVVILSAHLDSTAYPSTIAPGADDNATGSATLLEAARVLRGHPLKRTFRLIWFTGEEQWLLGSRAYVNNPNHSLAGIVGVVNVDMFGYDFDEDHCFELHVGTLPASDRVGQYFIQAIRNYHLNLSYDYLTASATSSSDHSSFWDKGIGAVEVLENYEDNSGSGVCKGTDWNPNYHSKDDTFDKIRLPFAFDVARAALATVFSMANVHTYYFSLVKN